MNNVEVRRYQRRSTTVPTPEAAAEKRAYQLLATYLGKDLKGLLRHPDAPTGVQERMRREIQNDVDNLEARVLTEKLFNGLVENKNSDVLSGALMILAVSCPKVDPDILQTFLCGALEKEINNPDLVNINTLIDATHIVIPFLPMKQTTVETLKTQFRLLNERVPQRASSKGDTLDQKVHTIEDHLIKTIVKHYTDNHDDKSPASILEYILRNPQATETQVMEKIGCDIYKIQILKPEEYIASKTKFARKKRPTNTIITQTDADTYLAALDAAVQQAHQENPNNHDLKKLTQKVEEILGKDVKGAVVKIIHDRLYGGEKQYDIMIRRAQLLELAKQNPSMTRAELAKLAGVSLRSVNKDILNDVGLFWWFQEKNT